MKTLIYYFQILLAVIVGVCGLALIVLGPCYEKELAMIIGILGILFPIIILTADNKWLWKKSW